MISSIVLAAGMLSVVAQNPEIVCFKNAKLDVNETIPEETRGYTLRKGKEGTIVHFIKYQKGKTSSWPYVGVRGKEIKLRDWRSYKFLMVQLRNLDPEISPTVGIVVRDTSGKAFRVPCRVRCNTLNTVVIPITEFARKVDVGKVNLLQLAIPNCPYNIELELISASLSGKAGPVDPNKEITRIFDIKNEILAGKRGLQSHGINLDMQSGDPVITVKQYRAGMDKWPGLNLKSGVDEMLLEGDWSTKTHLVAELELLQGEITLDLRFEDNDGKRFWNGIGSLKKNETTSVDLMIYDMGIDLSHINRIYLGCTMPSNDGSYRIKAFHLEFRPETLYTPAVAKINKLLKLDLNEKERTEVMNLKKQLDITYALVRGKYAKYGDIRNFINITEKSKQATDSLLRINQFRQARENMSSYPYAVGLSDSMTSVFIDNKGFVMKPAKKAFLEMAKNEYESFQVVVISNEKKVKATISISPLKGPDGATIQTESAVVGFAKTERPRYPVEYVGWYPDFIIRYQQSAWIQKNEAVPFWIRLHTAKDTPTGLYQGTVTVTVEGEKSYSFPLEVKVFNFTLPEGAPLPTAYDVAGSLHVMYRPISSSDTRKLHRDFARYAASYKLTYDRLYYGPYGTPKYVSDNWKMLHDSSDLKSFCIVNATPYSKFVKDRTDPNDPGVERLLRGLPSHIAEISKHAKNGGYYDKAYFYGFDEWKIDAVTNRIFGFLKKNWPEIPIMTTAAVPYADLPGLENIDIWVPIAKHYAENPELIRKLRKRGIKVWWYICNYPRPPEPSFMLEVPATVPRLFMGMMTQKYKPEGFLYWSLIAWRSKQLEGGPVQYGPRTHWNPNTGIENEEGNFFVPGRDRILLPTIRVENFRDGVEDLWYYTLLQQSLAKVKTSGKKVPTDLINAVEAALNVPDSIVKNTKSYTTDPDQIRAERLKIAKLIEALQEN